MELPFFSPTRTRYPDPEAHEPGCMCEEEVVSAEDPIGGYVDLFCSCHRYTEQKLLSNGVDVAWPAGWDSKQASAWRAANGLVQPTSK